METLCGVFVQESGGWIGAGVIAREVHPSEDVALIKLFNDKASWKSFLRLSNSIEHATCKYRLFGYPDDTTFELVEGDRAITRPDLVYNEGYIRRRYTGSLPTIQGSSFFELSEVAGSGASGAPIIKLIQSPIPIKSPAWDVIGIYVGERLNDRATSVSYAVREDAFRNWSPEILGKTVLVESLNISKM